MLNTSARLLRLLALFQSRRYWAGEALASRLEITPRTLRRDVDRLRSLGYPVNSTCGAGGGYQLGAGATLPPLLLDNEEAVAVAVGLRTAASGAVTGIEEASVRALLKLEQVMPSALRRRVAALHAFIVPLASQGPTVDATMLAQIAAACRDHELLRFRYEGRDKGAGPWAKSSAPERNVAQNAQPNIDRNVDRQAQRCVEPYRLVHTGRRWYVLAYDTARGDWRTFRVDRIAPKLSAGGRFAPRKLPAEDADIAAYVTKGVSYRQYAHRARVTLFTSLAQAAEWIPPTIGTLEAIADDEQTCTLYTGAHSLDVLAFHLAMMGADFKVHEPPELITHVQKLADRLTHAAARARPTCRMPQRGASIIVIGGIP